MVLCQTGSYLNSTATENINKIGLEVHLKNIENSGVADNGFYFHKNYRNGQFRNILSTSMGGNNNKFVTNQQWGIDHADIIAIYIQTDKVANKINYYKKQ